MKLEYTIHYTYGCPGCQYSPVIRFLLSFIFINLNAQFLADFVYIIY